MIHQIRAIAAAIVNKKIAMRTNDQDSYACLRFSGFGRHFSSPCIYEPYHKIFSSEPDALGIVLHDELHEFHNAVLLKRDPDFLLLPLDREELTERMHDYSNLSNIVPRDEDVL
jgi:hypothetical protein